MATRTRKKKSIVEEPVVEEVPEEVQELSDKEKLNSLMGILNEDQGPLVLTVAVSRITKRPSIAISSSQKNPLEDLSLLVEAVDHVRKLLDQSRIEAVRQEAIRMTQENGQEANQKPQE